MKFSASPLRTPASFPVRTHYFLAGLASVLMSCQQAKPVATDAPQTAAAPTEATAPTQAALTEAAAREAITRYLKGQSNANLYVVDSASVVDVDNHWQVLVPRTDWAGRMPNRAAFEVDKQTGTVRTLMVK
ncbi:hypothetical protein [Hymenobacter crusticola]|uniref:NTF2 fold domain-containing protein n=1 Tax=Hymenobacter crusticola TaxID=1770526 RepID=A0A243W9S0_9BACT|nr:hypothetical protein [Hymenobacter crusticola]OUJ72284.1 hypothetical protein BXP70_18665 [Hymenobacter crusticola]